MYDFNYHRASSVDEAVQSSESRPTTDVFLAGGHTLVPTLKQRLASPSDVVDLAGLGMARHLGLGRCRHHRGGRQPCLGGGLVAMCRAPSRRSRSGRPYRRPACAGPRHHRRLDRQ